jgi:hypothetical protein
MNTQEARAILSEVMREYRQKDYSYWENSIPESPLVISKAGESGVDYCIEIDIVRDAPKSRTIRVVFGIDDGGWRASFSPMTDDFLVEPEEMAATK